MPRSKTTVCPRCKQNPKDKKQSYCKTCAQSHYRGLATTKHKQALLRKYGISPEVYDALNIAQNGLCKVCSRPQKSGRRLAVDHSHSTGKFRGLLCNHCNVALGLLNEDPAIMQALIKYVQEAV